MIKDHYFVGRSERNDVRQVGVHLGLHVGLRKLTPTYRVYYDNLSILEMV